MIDPVARLLAIEEIKQLKARYFRHMDMRDWAAMGEVFCKDARFDCSEGFGSRGLDGEWSGEIGPVTVGRDRIMPWISSSFATTTSAHHGHCHEIWFDSDSQAHGICSMEDWILDADRKTLLINAAGHYHEKYRVEDGAWRIAEVKLTRLFVGLNERAI
jgi:SnoaL-like domain